MRARSASASAATGEILLIPGDRARESGLEIERGRPGEPLARLGGAQPLVADLGFRRGANVGLERGAHGRQDPASQIEHGELDLVGEVECLAVQLRARAYRLGERDIRGGAVLDVEVVADWRPVGANHRPLTAKHGANGAGHEAVPVEITAAVEVAAARDAD